ncbi:protein DPCD [Arctopsyche grandis]|uniref:protein DPCD n=1 Tax=Arctopsyche grandis TaxID=121162 RepID=UPI00406DA36E
MKRKLIFEMADEGPAVKMATRPLEGPDHWLRILKAAEKSSFVNGNNRRVLCRLGDGREMLEEYSMATGCVTRRAWKSHTPLRGPPEWQVELGEPPSPPPLTDDGLRESNDQPILTRRNTKKCLEWRIRNLPYPIETYSVAANASEKCIFVRTTNKKYFKKLQIPELDRIGTLPVQANVEYSHKFNTLIISYKKPPELIQFEKLWLEELNNVKEDDNPMDECKPS